MTPFKHLKSKVIPLDVVNVDTDQIIPKQFLKLLGKTGYGEYLFYNWRYDKNGNPDTNFILNTPNYSGRQILLTRENFGIGSSREHAVWAIRDFGFKVIIGASFADIFYNNCSKNGILVIKLDKTIINDFFLSHIDDVFEVDLLNQQIKVNSITYEFSIDSKIKQSLLEGADEISTTLLLENYIKDYEIRNNSRV